jgi:hypothetical protein
VAKSRPSSPGLYLCRFDAATHFGRQTKDAGAVLTAASTAVQQRLTALKADVEAISRADQLYWRQKSHGREATRQYQGRIERLEEIRQEMAWLISGTN